MGRPPIPDSIRFLQSFIEASSGCWEWQNALNSEGYGRIKIGSLIDGSARTVYAHRWSYERIIGPIPSGLFIDHLCRNRKCVNPAHLEPVTHLENQRRGYYATKTHCSKGHSLSGYNLYRRPDGARACVTCLRRRSKEHAERTNNVAAKRYYREHKERYDELRRQSRERARARKKDLVEGG
jgi:hypothetical protein